MTATTSVRDTKDRMPHPLQIVGGSHAPETGMGCVMNVVSWVSGENPVTDHPACIAPEVAAVFRCVDDYLSWMPTSDFGATLEPLEPHIAVRLLDLAFTAADRLPDALSLHQQVVWQRETGHVHRLKQRGFSWRLEATPAERTDITASILDALESAVAGLLAECQTEPVVTAPSL